MSAKEIWKHIYRMERERVKDFCRTTWQILIFQHYSDLWQKAKCCRYSYDMEYTDRLNIPLEIRKALWQNLQPVANA